MKNIIKLIRIISLVAIIGFSIVACEQVDVTEATTDGRLTIAGLDAYNGMKIEAYYNDDIWLHAAGRAENFYQSSDNTSGMEKTYPATITGGEVILKVFLTKNGTTGNGKNNGGYYNYIGNHKNVRFSVSINESAFFGSVTVNFTSGIGSGVFVLDNVIYN